MEKSTTGCFSTTVTMPSTISGPKCIGQRWKNSIKASKGYKSRKAFARSSARICWVFSTPICQNGRQAARLSRQTCLWHVVMNRQARKPVCHNSRGRLFSETCSQLFLLGLVLFLQPTHFRGKLFLE